MSSLRIALLINAASCLAFGLLFVANAPMVANWLGSFPSTFLFWLGILLSLNGVHLIVAAARQTLLPSEIIWFSVGDLLWWLASLGLLATKTWVTHIPALWATFFVALGVAILGVWQLAALSCERRGQTGRQFWRQIGQSWLALPVSVKLWLFFLNAAFLTALAFWPSDLALVSIVAYVATGPVLMAVIVLQGGLTRATGLGHLPPWLPLAAYLATQSNLSTPQGFYALSLLSVVSISLVFDLWDLIRFARGERAIFTPMQTATA